MPQVDKNREDAQVLDLERTEAVSRDRALISLYVLVTIVAMAGWFWFLGLLSWKIVGWAIGDLL
jgi:hypothetical protein